MYCWFAFHNIDICLAEYVRAHRLSKGLPIDRHIDHRRVRNLGALFTADGLEIPVNQSRYVADYYQPGDIIFLLWEVTHTFPTEMSNTEKGVIYIQ